MSGRSLERDMLQAIALHHPVDHLKLKRILNEWRGQEVDFSRFKDARSNLIELGLVKHPKMDVQYYLTADGWAELGGETPLEGDSEPRSSTVLY